MMERRNRELTIYNAVFKKDVTNKTKMLRSDKDRWRMLVISFSKTDLLKTLKIKIKVTKNLQ